MEEARKETAGAESPADSVKEVEVLGHQVNIDMGRLQTWRAFKLVRKIDEGNDLERIDAAVAFAELVSDKDEDAIVEMMGGDDATIMDVVGFSLAIIQAVYPKN